MLLNKIRTSSLVKYLASLGTGIALYGGYNFKKSVVEPIHYSDTATGLAAGLATERLSEERARKELDLPCLRDVPDGQQKPDCILVAWGSGAANITYQSTIAEAIERETQTPIANAADCVVGVSSGAFMAIGMSIQKSDGAVRYSAQEATRLFQQYKTIFMPAMTDSLNRSAYRQAFNEAVEAYNLKDANFSDKTATGDATLASMFGPEVRLTDIPCTAATAAKLDPYQDYTVFGHIPTKDGSGLYPETQNEQAWRVVRASQSNSTIMGAYPVAHSHYTDVGTTAPILPLAVKLYKQLAPGQELHVIIANGPMDVRSISSNEFNKHIRVEFTGLGRAALSTPNAVRGAAVLLQAAQIAAHKTNTDSLRNLGSNVKVYDLTYYRTDSSQPAVPDSKNVKPSYTASIGLAQWAVSKDGSLHETFKRVVAAILRNKSPKRNIERPSNPASTLTPG